MQTSSDARSMASEGLSLLFLSRCVLKNPSTVRDRSVCNALDLDSRQRPPDLLRLRPLSYREFAVPLQPGLTAQARTANVYVCVLAVVEGKCSLRPGEPVLCGRVMKSGNFLEGFRRSVVALTASDVSRDVLSLAWPFATLTATVDDLMTPGALCPHLMASFGSVVEAQLDEISNHMSSKPTM